MKNKLLILTIVGLLLAGVSVFIYPVIEAQILQTETKPSDEALLLVNSQPISNTFYEGLKENGLFRSNNLKLTKAFFNKQSQEENAVKTADFEEWYWMEFKNNNDRIGISIYEYKSPEIASKMLDMLWYSQGYIESTEDFGDDGIRMFDAKGASSNGVRFRKDKFNIYISCKSEELLKVFAENALKSIEGK